MAAMARSYTIVGGQLYEGKELLSKIHSGSYGSHIGPRALSAKAIRQGFYSPTHVRDTEQITKTCEAYQNFSPLQSRPSVEIQLISPIWPLQRWGMDLVGPLPPSQRGNKFAVVTI
jgi:hypothetical protein